jgi:hypothetical protein
MCRIITVRVVRYEYGTWSRTITGEHKAVTEEDVEEDVWTQEGSPERRLEGIIY